MNLWVFPNIWANTGQCARNDFESFFALVIVSQVKIADTIANIFVSLHSRQFCKARRFGRVAPAIFKKMKMAGATRPKRRALQNCLLCSETNILAMNTQQEPTLKLIPYLAVLGIMVIPELIWGRCTYMIFVKFSENVFIGTEFKTMRKNWGSPCWLRSGRPKLWAASPIEKNR